MARPVESFIPTPSQNTPQLAAGMNGRHKNPSCGVNTPQEGVWIYWILA